MTARNGASAPGALDAVRRLETALGERTGANDAAGAGLDAARAEAEQLLADARTAGLEAGRRHRAEMLAQAATDALTLRAEGHADAEELHKQASARRDQLVAELTALLLPEEA